MESSLEKLLSKPNSASPRVEVEVRSVRERVSEREIDLE